MNAKALVSFIIGVSFLLSLSAAVVPNRQATVTLVATGSCGCGGVASTKVKGNATNGALKSMGISSVSMEGPTVYNNDLSANPPHWGGGDGSASVTQTGTCLVKSDAQGNITTFPSYVRTSNTRNCSNGE